VPSTPQTGWHHLFQTAQAAMMILLASSQWLVQFQAQGNLLATFD
jgi:hypothetical protein